MWIICLNTFWGHSKFLPNNDDKEVIIESKSTGNVHISCMYCVHFMFLVSVRLMLINNAYLKEK